jgi:hypothetical protein
MAFQGFSSKMNLAIKIAKAKGATAQPIDQAEKDRRKRLADVRNEKRLAENLAQRALVESHRR